MEGKEWLDVHPTAPAWGHGYTTGVRDIRLHYVRQPQMGHKPAGRGVPVLMLHGWPGFWYDYRRLIPVLASEADLIVPDFRGFGDSDHPNLAPLEGYNAEHHMADMLALLDHLGIEQAVVVGHDIGSVVAQTLARQAPDRVQALVLFNPSYPGMGARRFEPEAHRELWYQYLHHQGWAADLVGYNRDTVRVYLAHFYDYWVGRKESVRPAEFEGIVDTYARPAAFNSSIQWYRARAQSGARERMAAADPTSLRIAQPAFIVWGEADPVFPSPWADRLGEYFSDLRFFRTLSGVGHFVPFEAPDDALSAIRMAISAVKT